MMSSSNKRTHTEYASGVQPEACSAKHLRTENDSQSPIEIPLSTNEVVRGAIRSLPPQAVEDMLVSAAMRDVSLLKEIKEAYAHLANTRPSPFTPHRYIVGLEASILLRSGPASVLSAPRTIHERHYLDPVEGEPRNLYKSALASEARRPMSELNTNAIPRPAAYEHPASRHTTAPTPATNAKTIASNALPASTSVSSENQTIGPQNEFEHCCDAVWKLVNEQFGALLDFQKTYGVEFCSDNAVGNVILCGIEEKISPESSFETKLNALRALLEIGMTVMWASSDEFAQKTREGPVPLQIEGAIHDIVERMTIEERSMVWQVEDWANDVEHLQEASTTQDVHFYLMDEAIELCRSAVEDSAVEASACKIENDN